MAKDLIRLSPMDSEKEANQEFRHDFYIPAEARWEKLSSVRSKVGEKIDHLCKLIEEANPKLSGVLTNTKIHARLPREEALARSK